MEKNFSQVEDIIADESFQSWYFKTANTDIAAWEAWMDAHPEQESLVKEAVKFMDQLSVIEKEVPENQLVAAEQRLKNALEERMNRRRPQVVAMQRTYRRWWWAAAAILVLSLGSIALWSITNKSASVQTAYGEIREQYLPDGSKVLLNAHSEITYHKGWEKGVEREVWLKGEAFFHVKKTPEKSRFIVHTDRFDVIVTGTQFNVVNRADRTNIMLTEGSVTLHTSYGKDINMKPGDFVEFNNSQLEKKAVKEEDVLAWRDKKLFFHDTPMRVAAKEIEEHYGITIKLENEAVGDKPLSGILPNDNLDVLLQALEATNNFKVIRKDKEIIITD